MIIWKQIRSTQEIFFAYKREFDSPCLIIYGNLKSIGFDHDNFYKDHFCFKTKKKLTFL